MQKKSRTWAEKWQNLQAFCQVVVEPLATVVFRAACDRSQAIHTYAKDKRMKSKIGVTRIVRTQGAPGRKQLPVASNSCLYKR